MFCCAWFQAKCTAKGCVIEGRKLSKWQTVVRGTVCIALPAGKYQCVSATVLSVNTVHVPVHTASRELPSLLQSNDCDKEASGIKRKVKVEGGGHVLVEEGVKYEVDEYINYYTCKPPPLFMLLITVLQVTHDRRTDPLVPWS